MRQAAGREAVRGGGHVQVRRAVVPVQRQGFIRDEHRQAGVLPSLQRTVADRHHGRVRRVPFGGRIPRGVPRHVRRVIRVPGGRRHGRRRQQSVGETAQRTRVPVAEHVRQPRAQRSRGGRRAVVRLAAKGRCALHGPRVCEHGATAIDRRIFSTFSSSV